jgi:hypothetical protein
VSNIERGLLTCPWCGRKSVEVRGTGPGTWFARCQFNSPRRVYGKTVGRVCGYEAGSGFDTEIEAQAKVVFDNAETAQKQKDRFAAYAPKPPITDENVLDAARAVLARSGPLGRREFVDLLSPSFDLADFPSRRRGELNAAIEHLIRDGRLLVRYRPLFRVLGVAESV